jgi:putative copper resistance protein D
VLFGQFAFATLVAADRQPGAHFRRATAWSIGALLLSALAWLSLEAISMSGLPAREALSPATLGTVVAQTQFGRVWLARFLGAGLALIAILGKPRLILGGVASGFVLVALAAMGHGGSGRGVAGALHLGIDAAHLLAAGAWLGALVPLVPVVRSAERGDERRRRFAVDTTARFSTLGLFSMQVIFASGVGNACYMLSGFPALVDSTYGRWLLAKLVLFAAILGLAAINRWRLRPRLEFHGLARNAVAECVLGFGIVAIVGELGITIPAGHHANMPF